MAETLTIRTASSTEVVKISSQGPQGPKGDKGDPGDVAGLPLSAQGDLLYRGASENQRLPIGASGQILKVAGGVPSWANESGAVTSVNNQTGSVSLGLANVRPTEIEVGVAINNDENTPAIVNPTTAQLPANVILFLDAADKFARVNLPNPGRREAGLSVSIKVDQESVGDAVFLTVAHSNTVLHTTEHDLDEGDLKFVWDGYQWNLEPFFPAGVTPKTRLYPNFAGIFALLAFANPPATKTSAGVAGQIVIDAAYLYLCKSTNNWIRIPLASWS